MKIQLTTNLLETAHSDTAADVDLVSAAQSGDHVAFAELWRRYSKKMFNMIMRITRNHEDAEDALQDSFMRAYTHLTDFHGKSKFSSWMTSIAINSALMSLRKRRSRPTLSMDGDDSDLPLDYREPVAAGMTAEDECIRREQLRNVTAAITRLRRPLRGVLEIHLVQAGKVEELADTAGISISAAKSRLMRAKNEIRNSMSRRGQL
jgi:RNA polymerase sigma-70 factor (ECF subfamily)